jgi:hypothetical protein
MAGMIEVARYAPVRIVLVGIGRMIIGAVALALGALIVFITTRAPAAAPSAADRPAWLIPLIGAFFLFVGLAIFLGGVGRTLSAFARNCYLRASQEGIALRLPVQGWFGPFRLREFQLRWSEIAELVHFTYRVNAFRPAASCAFGRAGRADQSPALHFLRYERRHSRPVA